MQKLGRWQKMDEAQIVAEWLGMTAEQAEELKQRLQVLKTDNGGFGTVRIDVKRWQVYRISHVVEGKPVVFRDEE